MPQPRLHHDFSNEDIWQEIAIILGWKMDLKADTIAKVKDLAIVILTLKSQNRNDEVNQVMSTIKQRSDALVLLVTKTCSVCKGRQTYEGLDGEVKICQNCNGEGNEVFEI